MSTNRHIQEAMTTLLTQYHDLLSQIERIGEAGHIDVTTEPDPSVTFEPTDLAYSLQKQDQVIHSEILEKIDQIKEKITRLSWMSEHLKILHELGQTFTRAVELEEIYQKAYELVSRVMPTNAFLIAFYQEGSPCITFPYAIDNLKRYEIEPLPYGQGNVSKVLATKETVHLQTLKALNQSTPRRWGNVRQQTSTAIYVPMLLGDQIKGVISAQSYQEFAYTKEHEELLRMIGYQVASAIETAQLYEQLYKKSILDEMTGLKNYRAFHQDLKELLNREAESYKVILIMIDSDNLKKVNDQYGHHMGDQLLIRIAEAMKAGLQEEEGAYRYAGDEFMLLLPNQTIQAAEQRIAEIRKYLEQHPLVWKGEIVPISISAGMALYPDHAKDSDSLKRAADIALYRSKSEGKNRTTILG